MSKLKYSLSLFLVLLFVSSCSISYKFNGASIDYSKTKSISIVDFPNVAESVYPPLSSTFSEALRDKYSRQTRLIMLKSGGDLDLEGEITGYTLTPLSIGTDALASETRLTLTIKVRFANTKQPEDDFEKSYSAAKVFDSQRLLSDVQDDLLVEMIEEICSSIYNDTVAQW